MILRRFSVSLAHWGREWTMLMAHSRGVAMCFEPSARVAGLPCLAAHTDVVAPDAPRRPGLHGR